jgi:hypothetical protein
MFKGMILLPVEFELDGRSPEDIKPDFKMFGPFFGFGEQLDAFGD